jgi:mono/diheme cytochrome c family protein
MWEKLYHFILVNLRDLMSRSREMLFAVVISMPIAAVVVAAIGVTPPGTAQQKGGWTLPADAADTKSPLTVDDKVLAIGKKIFTDKCQKCHGPKGLGDGPDADPDHAEDMNLTNPKRTDRNPDGVVFYKVLNGRRSPKMPALKDQLSTEQIWSVVAYVQTFRKK